MLNLPGLCLLAILSFSAAAAPLQTTLNYREINPSLLSSGQISPAQVSSLKEAGIDLVINLTMEASEENAQEGYAITKLGIDYVHIPVPWSAQPRKTSHFFLASWIWLVTEKSWCIATPIIVLLRLSTFTGVPCSMFLKPTLDRILTLFGRLRTGRNIPNGQLLFNRRSTKTSPQVRNSQGVICYVYQTSRIPSCSKT